MTTFRNVPVQHFTSLYLWYRCVLLLLKSCVFMFVLYSIWIICMFVLLECLFTVQFFHGFSSAICIVAIFILRFFIYIFFCTLLLCDIYVSRDNIFAFPTVTTLCVTEILHHYSCHKCFKSSSSAIQELSRPPESVISLVASLTVSSKIWTPMKSHAIQNEQYVFRPAVLLMCCFFDYIFKSC